MVRRILVTGANKGIGYAIASRCLQDYEDTFVILGCRSTARGEAALRDLTAVGGPAWKERLSVLEIDTSSKSSVDTAAHSLKAELGTSPPPLYGIVNNAGIASGSLSEILETNVRGPHRVDESFLPLLDPQKGRIVQMSSGAASGCVSKSSPARRAFFVDGQVTWEQIETLMREVEAYPNGAQDLEANGIGASMGGYGLSKALLNAYTQMLAREHPNLKINSCSPGMIATDYLASILPSPDEGTVSTMYLLFDDGLEGNGRYYGSDAKRSPLDTYRSPGSAPYEGS